MLGLILGFVGVRALLAISPAGLPRIGEDGSAIGMDWRVLAFTLARLASYRHSVRSIPRLHASRAPI